MFGMGGQAKPQPQAEKAPAARKKAQLVGVTLKLTPAQRDKLELLGGEAWLREQIDQAEPPSPFGLSA
jgi:hypothetical protein